MIFEGGLYQENQMYYLVSKVRHSSLPTHIVQPNDSREENHTAF